MWLDIFWVALGLIFLIAVMALILNPPERWVKRAFVERKTGEKGSQKPH